MCSCIRIRAIYTDDVAGHGNVQYFQTEMLCGYIITGGPPPKKNAEIVSTESI